MVGRLICLIRRSVYLFCFLCNPTTALIFLCGPCLWVVIQHTANCEGAILVRVHYLWNILGRKNHWGLNLLCLVPTSHFFLLRLLVFLNLFFCYSYKILDTLDFFEDIIFPLLFLINFRTPLVAFCGWTFAIFHALFPKEEI